MIFKILTLDASQYPWTISNCKVYYLGQTCTDSIFASLKIVFLYMYLTTYTLKQ